MGHMSIAVHANHAETERVTFDEAVAAFTDALRTRGYLADVSVEWSGESRTQSLNRDGTGGRVLESERAPGGQTRAAEAVEGAIHGDPDIVQATAGSNEPTVEVKSKGGGYYDIVVDGEVVDTVRGKDAAEAWTP